MSSTIWERCRMIKLTSAQFEEGLGHGWPHEEHGVALVTLTPALAQRLLAGMHKNRPSKPRNKAKVVAALVGEYFRPNGETIILSATLDILDGEHRLKACVESKKSLTSLVTWGWPNDCFDTIDTGTKRSGGDMFSADGELNATLLSAAVRYDWRIIHKDMLSGNQIPEPRMRTHLQANEGLRTSMSWSAKVSHLIPKGMAVALHYRFSQKDAPLAKQFFVDLSKGENINSQEHTAWHLRDLLLLRHTARLQLSTSVQAQTAANVIKAWNGVRAGKVLVRRSLMWEGEKAKPEAFPEIR